MTLTIISGQKHWFMAQRSLRWRPSENTASKQATPSTRQADHTYTSSDQKEQRTTNQQYGEDDTTPPTSSLSVLVVSINTRSRFTSMQQEQFSQMVGDMELFPQTASSTSRTSKFHTAAEAITPAENRKNMMTQHHHPRPPTKIATNRRPDGMEHQTLGEKI
jgi:hypothetical protein